MPKQSKKDSEKRAVGVPSRIYDEIEEYASKQSPQLFLYEVIIKSWQEYKKNHKIK